MVDESQEQMPAETEAIDAVALPGTETESSEPTITDDGVSRLKRVVRSYLDRLDSLESTLRGTMLLASAMRSAAQEDLENYARKFGEDFEPTDEGFSVRLTGPHKRRADRLERRLRRTNTGLEIVPRSFVVALVSEYDAFLGALLKAVFLRRPELLSGSGRSVAVAELFDFQTLEDAKGYVLDQEIESVLRESHTKHFDWMENRFDLSLRKGLAVWPTFVELTERRNLFVHADGVVSEQYLSACSRAGVELENGLEVGQVVSVSPDYFKRAHACLYEIGAKLFQVLWRKLFAGELEDADDDLNEHVFDLLVDGKYTLASCLLDFACEKFIRHGTERGRRIFVVNRAQA